MFNGHLYDWDNIIVEDIPSEELLNMVQREREHATKEKFEPNF